MDEHLAALFAEELGLVIEVDGMHNAQLVAKEYQTAGVLSCKILGKVSM